MASSNPPISPMKMSGFQKEDKYTTGESPANSPLKSSFSKLFLKSDIHGWSDWYEASKIREKIFWSVLIITATGIMIYELVLVFIDYRDNPILTTYGLIADPLKLPFPEIYLCPSNPIHSETWKQANVDKDWEGNNTKGVLKTHSDGNGLTGMLAQKATISESMGYLFHPRSGPGYSRGGNHPVPPKPNGPPWIPEDIQEYFIRVGYPTETFLNECAFSSRSVACKEIVETVFDGNFGKCFLLKTGNFTQSVAGLGLSLVINLDFDNAYPKGEFDPPMYDGVVMKIDTKLDIASQKNILLYPGTYTKIAIEAMKMNLMQRDKKEAGQICVSDKESKGLTKILKGQYSPGLCQLDCVYSVISNNCDCSMAIDKKLLRNHTKFCSPELLSNCSYPAISSNALEINKCSQKCHISCSLWQYTIDSSMARFPSNSMTTFSLPLETVDNNGTHPTRPLPPGSSDRPGTIPTRSPEEIEKEKKSNEAKKLMHRWMRGDYIILDVAFSSLQYVEVTQKPSMTLNTFISNVGGQMGLWIGASIVTLIKCIIFLTPACCILCKKTRPVTPQNE